MEPIDPRIDDVLRSGQGIVTTADAVARGLTGNELAALRRHGRLVRLRHGCYVHPDLWRDADARARHLLLARAVARALTTPYRFSYDTSALLHGQPEYGLTLDEVDVTRPDLRSATRHEAGVWHHRGAIEPSIEIHGLRTLTLAQTVVDLARTTSPAAALVQADAALAAGVTRSELVDLALAQRVWPGAARALTVVQLAETGSESVGESLTRYACHVGGLPAPVLQHVVRVGGKSYRADLALVEHRVLIEFDGQVKYGRLLGPGETTSSVLVAERRRELALESAGWVVVRFTWAEIHDVELVRSRVLHAIARATHLQAG